MFTWIKALFSKELTEISKNDFIPFTEILSEELLVKVYDIFEKHINEDNFTTNFQQRVVQNILFGNDWDNISKITGNLGVVGLTKESLAEYIENICYNTWFAGMSADGHRFTQNEKSALLGYNIYLKKNEEFVNAERAIRCTRTTGTFLINSCFESDLKAALKDYAKFISREGCAA